MSPLAPSRNIAARMGRWSANHWKTATFGWLAFVLAAFAIGNALGTKQIDQNKAGNGESGHVKSVLADEFKQSASETVLVQSPSRTLDDASFRAAVQDVTTRLVALPQVRDVRSPLVPGNGGQVSSDRRSAIVQFKLRGTDETASEHDVVAVEAAVAALGKSHPGFTIGEFGDASASKALNDAVGKDFAKAGLFSIPVTLVVLVVAFGALIAAGLPILLALTGVFGTLGLLAVPSHLIPMDQDASVIVLLIGLAVGVDYSLFYLKREREERERGAGPRAALEAAAATSGRSVLISGLTVMVAMAGMFLTGDKSFMSFGLATMMVVAVAVLGSLTVLPALLGRTGDKIHRGRIPFVHRIMRPGREPRVWGAILDRVLRRPAISAALAAGVLVALAAPALHLHTNQPGLDTFPKSLSVMKTYDRLEKAFPGEQVPALVMVKTDDVASPAATKAIHELERRALATGRFNGPTTVDTNARGTVATIALPINGNGTDAASSQAVRTLRDDLIPATVGKLPNADVGVAGFTAESDDFNTQMKHAAPYVFGFVLAFAFILLLLSFRSVVIAVKAVVLNLLSVAASYGVLVLVFQDGWGKGLLGFSQTGGIVAFLPILLFVILFGLSMDYHVFILSRVREAFDRGMTTDEAVAHGIKSTASVVTSAAIVMVGVFSIFATLQFMFLKQFGVGLAAAVLIDATIVRAVLLPATMKLLGDANWYLPRWLEWLPQIRHETEGPAAQRAPEAPAELAA
jgi:RND superfamily putative drug exporter